MALRPPPNQTRANQLASAKDLSHDVFMREVDDALREDQFHSAIRRWGKPLAAAIVVGLAGLGGWLWYGENRAAAANRTSEAYTQALDKVEAGENDQGNAALAALQGDATPGYKYTAQLMQAGVALQQGKADAALATWNRIAADTSAPQPYRDLATLRAVNATFDTMKPDDVVARLKPLAVSGGAWNGSAGEMLGLAYLKQGRKDLAGPIFAEVARDKGVPESIRGRARQIAEQLGLDAGDEPQIVTPAR